jgi:hypothetical protein
MPFRARHDPPGAAWRGRHRARLFDDGDHCGTRSGGRARRACALREGNVYDAPALLNAQYDIAFVTWGSIIWLPDIRLWAQIVAELLAPGGSLYLAEGHPSTLSLDEVDGRLVALQSWRTPPSAPFFTMRRRRTPAIQRRSPIPKL